MTPAPFLLVLPSGVPDLWGAQTHRSSAPVPGSAGSPRRPGPFVGEWHLNTTTRCRACSVAAVSLPLGLLVGQSGRCSRTRVCRANESSLLSRTRDEFRCWRRAGTAGQLRWALGSPSAGLASRRPQDSGAPSLAWVSHLPALRAGCWKRRPGRRPRGPFQLRSHSGTLARAALFRPLGSSSALKYRVGFCLERLLFSWWHWSGEPGETQWLHWFAWPALTHQAPGRCAAFCSERKLCTEGNRSVREHHGACEPEGDRPRGCVRAHTRTHTRLWL